MTGAPPWRVATDADDAPVVDHDLVDGELLADLGAALRRPRRRAACRAPSAAGSRRPASPAVPGRAGERERSEVEAVGVDRRAVRWRAVGRAGPTGRSAATPGGCTTCVESVSLGNVARSTRSTRWPWRASSMAVGEPAQRAPMTIDVVPVRGHRTPSARRITMARHRGRCKQLRSGVGLRRGAERGRWRRPSPAVFASPERAGRRRRAAPTPSARSRAGSRRRRRRRT